jgi:hypothetical protein
LVNFVEKNAELVRRGKQGFCKNVGGISGQNPMNKGMFWGLALKRISER